MDVRSRKALGCSVLLVYLALYTAAAAGVGGLLAPALPTWGELVYYAIAGIVWVIPLKPMFDWMREPRG
jgi:hypothetical protein